VFYRLVRCAFRIVAAALFRFRCEGPERVPPSGPSILIAPHRSWLDPACVGAACPRPVRFLILRNVYDKRWARWFYRAMGTLPVSPGGSASVVGMRGALRALRSGELVGVFPEGRVVPRGAGTPVHPGAAMLAVRARAPVVPVEIHGSAAAWPHGRKWPGPAPVRVRFRPAIAPPRGQDAEAVREMERRIASLMLELDRAGGAEIEPEGRSADAQGDPDRGGQ